MLSAKVNDMQRLMASEEAEMRKLSAQVCELQPYRAKFIQCEGDLVRERLNISKALQDMQEQLSREREHISIVTREKEKCEGDAGALKSAQTKLVSVLEMCIHIILLSSPSPKLAGPLKTLVEHADFMEIQRFVDSAQVMKEKSAMMDKATVSGDAVSLRQGAKAVTGAVLLKWLIISLCIAMIIYFYVIEFNHACPCGLSKRGDNFVPNYFLF